MNSRPRLAAVLGSKDRYSQVGKEGRKKRRGGKEGRKEGGKEGRREGRREGGKEGGKEGRREGGKEGRREGRNSLFCHPMLFLFDISLSLSLYLLISSLVLQSSQQRTQEEKGMVSFLWGATLRPPPNPPPTLRNLCLAAWLGLA